jgi:NADH dehydrogenase FAD-containing subunit
VFHELPSQTAQVAEQQGKYLGKKLKKLAATGHTQLQNMDIKDDMCVIFKQMYIIARSR